ncbi:MAG: hypothetical protein ABH877_01950 [bacterium]
MAPELRCKGMKADGKPCEAPERLVDPMTGYCLSHDPARREKLLGHCADGGKAIARRLRAKVLGETDLPPLASPQAAAAWLEIIGRAVATGRLSSRDADAVTRAVREWLKAHEAGDVADQIKALRETVAALKRTKTMEVVR